MINIIPTEYKPLFNNISEDVLIYILFPYVADLIDSIEIGYWPFVENLLQSTTLTFYHIKNIVMKIGIFGRFEILIHLIQKGIITTIAGVYDHNESPKYQKYHFSQTDPDRGAQPPISPSAPRADGDKLPFYIHSMNNMLLRMAIRYQHQDIIKFLIDDGANYVDSMLEEMLDYKFIPVMAKIIDVANKALEDIIFLMKRTLAYGNLVFFQHLLRSRKKDILSHKSHVTELIKIACETNRANIAKQLLLLHPNIDKYTIAACHRLASRRNNNEVTKLLCLTYPEILTNLKK